ncbi:hypothetical protein [Actinoplanes sp. NPDC026619]|uniref:hypothetical protein n=1 Tax=Actinoplanes sp. NPDC026619 TaxID=3155798 RepID=UPI0033E9692F
MRHHARVSDMRWAGQRIDALAPGTLPGLGRLNNLVRSVRTPEFEGVTFHEVLTRSALNHVPATSAMLPGEWTINPCRGCTHACAYCVARPTHEHLGLDMGADFDNQVIVQVNVGDVLRRELAARRRGRGRRPAHLAVSDARRQGALLRLAAPRTPRTASGVRRRFARATPLP